MCNLYRSFSLLIIAWYGKHILGQSGVCVHVLGVFMVVSGRDGMNASPNITIRSRPTLTKQHMLHFRCSKEENRSLFSAQQQCFQRHEVEKRALHPGELFISHHFSYW